LVRDKLKRQWLREVYFGIRDIGQPANQLALIISWQSWGTFARSPKLHSECCHANWWLLHRCLFSG